MFTNRGGRTLLGNLLWLIPSLAVWFMTLAWLGTIFIISVPAMLIGIPFERFQVKLHGMASWPVHFTGSRIKGTIDPRYDKNQVVTFMMNHTSMLDASVALGVVEVPMCGIENAAHLKLPGYGWLLRAANAIPVRRGSGGRYREVAKAVRERQSRGISVLAFPEGSRTLDGHLRQFRRGVFSICREAGVPIVPIAVRGAHRMLPKGAVTMRPTLLDIYIGAPIETEGLDDDQLDGLMERVHTVIEAWVERREQLGDLCLEPIPKAAKAS